MCQGPRTVQSEETEIPSLSEERKLKTKCFFLKSRKEATSVEFLGGGQWGIWRGTAQLVSPQAWGGWGQISLFSGALSGQCPAVQAAIVSPSTEKIGHSHSGRARHREAPEPLFSWD